MIPEKGPATAIKTETGRAASREATCLFGLITDKRSVSRRNRASWYLRKLNKVIRCEDSELDTTTPIRESPPPGNQDAGRESVELEFDAEDQEDIKLVSAISSIDTQNISSSGIDTPDDESFLVTPNTRVLFLSKSIASSIILDLSPSVVSVSSQNGCVFLDSMFDALKRVLHLLVKSHEIPSSSDARPHLLEPKVFVSVIAYTPFLVAKTNQVLVQNRKITTANIDQVLVELWISLNRLIQEIQELVSGLSGINLDFAVARPRNNTFTFTNPNTSGITRHPGMVLDDIYELGLFSSSLMPRLSRLSLIIISDGLFASTNNLNMFRLKSISISFVTLATEITYPDSCFGYAPYVDLMKFTARTTQGFYISHQDLMSSSVALAKLKVISLVSNPLYRLFCWTLHSEPSDDPSCWTPRASNHRKFEANGEMVGIREEHIARFFCVDQPMSCPSTNSPDLSNEQCANQNYHDWRSFKQLDRNLDADFEQVLSSLLREGYLIKNIQFKHKETSSIIARLVLHWKHNLDLEQELTSPYWSNTDPFNLSNNSRMRILKPFNTPLYGDTYCEIIVHGSYSFLHNLYCDKRTKRRSEYRDIAYKQFRQLIDNVLQTHERLQYLSRFYRDSSLSKVPSYLLHGNSLLYEQPHTHRLTSTIDNVVDESKTSEFQEYWQKISCLDTKSWKNLMHVHTLRLVLEHDQPKYKNIHSQNANGRYTHVQCRRALSAISNFIKTYSSFALLEDTTYIKFIYNSDDDLREIETSATKGFIVIRINKLLPTVVIHLMFTSGILDSHRVKIVSYLEEQLVNCKLRNVRLASIGQVENLLRIKTIIPSSESCCVLIKSPLERMLKIYNRNFVNDYLLNNMTHGLPGSCPYSLPQSMRMSNGKVAGSSHVSGKDLPEDCVENSLTRYNLVFGKYLYGIRVVHTLSNLPHDLIPSLTSSVLSKISSILVNLRIKQGFHIAFNNSGVMNLVVELAMKDHSSDDPCSGCLCQYLVFPPTVSSCSQALQQSVLMNPASTAIAATGVSSQPGSLSGSLANSEGFMRNALDSIANSCLRNDNGEIKIIKEYWIEQQYGISSSSENYHPSLNNMRYPEIVDHLFMTDSTIFEHLLTYDLLQLSCDKSTPYYEFDAAMVRSETKSASPISSPTVSSNSDNVHEMCNSSSPTLPSNLIEGNTQDGNSKIPLLELEYKFSLVKFLDLCQQASLHVLLFKDRSEFFEPSAESTNKDENRSSSNDNSNTTLTRRKMSVNVDNHDSEQPKREHRSSYQLDSGSQLVQTRNTIYSSSLNHLLLETLHKRLKQMHDKELQLTDADLKHLPSYLKRRTKLGSKEYSGDGGVFGDLDEVDHVGAQSATSEDEYNLEGDIELESGGSCLRSTSNQMEWRCFLRKGNQDNLMIVLVPSSIETVSKWVDYISHNGRSSTVLSDQVCPIFVFRCSLSMLNEQVLSFLEDPASPSPTSPVSPLREQVSLEADLSLHLGQPCKYMGKLQTYNDELNSEILPTALSPTASDEKSLELVHFRAFLRKVKNTVLKSRFSSLNDAYLSELFVHKDDIFYYINNVDADTQKKYHVSSQLKSLAEFIKSYEEYTESLPQEPAKTCDHLLNSILLQKCGLFINQPVIRFNESNPLLKQLHDKKLLHLMRCNYKVELPILEESLSKSKFLRKFLTPATHTCSLTTTHPVYQGRGSYGPYRRNQPTLTSGPMSTGTSSMGCSTSMSNDSPLASSLGRSSDGMRLMEVKSGSVGDSGSPKARFSERSRVSLAPKFSPNSSLSVSSHPSATNDSVILDAFRGMTCPISDVDEQILKLKDAGEELQRNLISLRHEAHLAEVLRLKSERKESHHYRRVLKSKTSYSQSHTAIDQALKRVDSLGRLEHFCLTPLLFSPSWRTKLAPVRDHTVESIRYQQNEGTEGVRVCESTIEPSALDTKRSSVSSDERLAKNNQQKNVDEIWHQMVCNNYIKEYEQYIQTLGFNSVQVRYPSGSKSSSGAQQQFPPKPEPRSSPKRSSSRTQMGVSSSASRSNSGSSVQLRNSNSTAAILTNSSNPTIYNTGYLIKFLNCGCLVFKVGFCKPYVYSILYSIEGERFNNSNAKMNMTSFLDELDNIKVTMHLHSFTYDYHLRSIYSYISGRQLTFSPGYHLISFVDDFRKYYQKAPNYARNHLLCGEISITDLKVCGQQLYNYIVTHNSTYNMEILEMRSSLSNLISSFSSRAFMDNPQKSETASLGESYDAQARSHANDYVLIELKREKVRYKDGRDSDVFDCGLMITHEVQQSSAHKNSLVLKYFLLFTNQRELYPKLVHDDDNIISLGCHRPIRLGVAQLGRSRHQSSQQVSQGPTTSTSTATLAPPINGHSDPEDVQSSEFQSSGEISGPQSIISTANSILSSNSGLQFGMPQMDRDETSSTFSSNQRHTQPTTPSTITSNSTLVQSTPVPQIKVDHDQSEEAPVVRNAGKQLDSVEPAAPRSSQWASSIEDSSSVTGGEPSPPVARRKRTTSSTSERDLKSQTVQERTICDEEITYLGYFSSDEMDMLKFLQEKTANLKSHIERVVRSAEVHYRRDYLWHKLMQHPNASSRSDELPLSVEELLQLIQIVEAVGLATLDPQLSVFTTMHINWYTKLLKAFGDLRQSLASLHRIYTVRASKILLLYIDPKCTSAFVLMAIDAERGSVELNMLLKDKDECKKVQAKDKSAQQQQQQQQHQGKQSPSSVMDLDQECRQMINDFINFCASFMWSTLTS